MNMFRLNCDFVRYLLLCILHICIEVEKGVVRLFEYDMISGRWRLSVLEPMMLGLGLDLKVKIFGRGP